MQCAKERNKKEKEKTKTKINRRKLVGSNSSVVYCVIKWRHIEYEKCKGTIEFVRKGNKIKVAAYMRVCAICKLEYLYVEYVYVFVFQL